MHVNSSRRGFIRGLAGMSAFAIGGKCFAARAVSGAQKIKLAVVGVIAQRVPGRLDWDSAKQSFAGNAAANALVKPYVRKGFEF